jgi:hypothetical protein
LKAVRHNVIDWRPALCHHGHFPEAGHLITGAPEEVMEGLSNGFASSPAPKTYKQGFGTI